MGGGRKRLHVVCVLRAYPTLQFVYQLGDTGFVRGGDGVWEARVYACIVQAA